MFRYKAVLRSLEFEKDTVAKPLLYLSCWLKTTQALRGQTLTLTKFLEHVSAKRNCRQQLATL